MALTAWTRELGTNQGRVAPAGWTPPAGDFAFVLGFDRPGRFEELSIGDYAEVSQSATLPGGTRLLRVTARLRPPAVVPVGARWRFSIRVDGTEHAYQFLPAGRTRDRVTLAANVSKLTAGAHTFAFRLALEVG